MMPDQTEWDTSELTDYRKAYLDAGYSFETIAQMVVREARVIDGRFESYRDNPKGVPKETKQICFTVEVNQKAYDLFYNAPDGLRGRYWQTPDRGFKATRHLIDSLKPKLLAYYPLSLQHPANNELVEDSLNGDSAKIWVYEKDENGNSIIDVHNKQRLNVPRWVANEANAEVNKGYWRWTPINDRIEVKGALLDPNGNEHIPEFKRDRSCQIHRYGFT